MKFALVLGLAGFEFAVGVVSIVAELVSYQNRDKMLMKLCVPGCRVSIPPLSLTCHRS